MGNIFALALLCKGNDILFQLRNQVEYGTGNYGLIGGKVELGERGLQAVHREVLEELGLDIPESAFQLVHTFHRKGTETEFIALCFKADISHLPEPRNLEPDKCKELKFFSFNALPFNILPAHKQALEYIKRNISYSEHGW